MVRSDITGDLIYSAPARIQVSLIEGCFDQRLFRSTKVDSIEDKSQFD